MTKHSIGAIATLSAALTAATAMCATAYAATIDAKWQPGPGNWTQPNWTFSLPPAVATFPANGNGDFFNVSIDGDSNTGSKVTLDTSLSVDNLTLDADDFVFVNNAALGIVRDGGRAASGRIDNAGTLQLEATGGTAAALTFTGPATLQGGGSVQLDGDFNTIVFVGDDPPGTMRTQSGIFSTTGDVLTNVDNTIGGSGLIGSPLHNMADGTVEASRNGAALVLSNAFNTDLVNDGTMQARNGGLLRLFVGTYDQTGGGTIRALANSTVQIENSGVTIAGGSLQSAATGELRLRSSSVTLDGVATQNLGTLNIDNDNTGNSNVTISGGTFVNGGTTLVRNSALTLRNLAPVNSGAIELTSIGNASANLIVDGLVDLSGGGTLRLGGDVNEVVWAPDDAPQAMRTRSQISATTNSLLRNFDNTIAGSGIILSPLHNMAGGVVDADMNGGALVLSNAFSTDLVNDGTMQASNGGILRMFFGIYDQGAAGPAGGTIQALAGSTVQIENSGVTINGGTLRALAGGEVRISGGNATLNDTAVDNAGILTIRRDSNNSSAVVMNGNMLSNSGSMTIDNSTLTLNDVAVVDNSGMIEATATGGRSTFISTDGTTIFQGGGTLRLGGDADFVVFDPDEDPDPMRARVTLGSSGFGTTIVNQNHTIAGSGFISFNFTDGSFDNLAGGIVDANQAGGSLVLTVGDKTNLGTMQASNGGVLRLFAGTIAQDIGGTDTGTIRAGAGSTVHIENSGVTIDGGALATQAGGALLVRRASVNINGVAIDNKGIMRVESSSIGSATVVLNDISLAGGQIIVDPTSNLRTNGVSSLNATAIQGSLTNLGDLLIGPGGVALSDTYSQTGGSTTLHGGTLAAANLAIQAGTLLAGNGTVVGTTAVDGTASAGMSAGILNFAGDAAFSGAILAELGGTAVDGALPLAGTINLATDPGSTQFDQYNVFGTATLTAGLAIDLSLISGFIPVIGDFFDIITADTLVADLGALAITAPGLGNGLYFDYSIVSFGGRDALRVLVAGNVAIPEASVIAMFAMGLVLLVPLALRRRHA